MSLHCYGGVVTVLWGSEMHWSTVTVLHSRTVKCTGLLVNCSANTLQLYSLYEHLFTYLQWAGLFTTTHHWIIPHTTIHHCSAHHDQSLHYTALQFLAVPCTGMHYTFERHGALHKALHHYLRTLHSTSAVRG